MYSFLFGIAASFAEPPTDNKVVQALAKSMGHTNIAPHHKGELIDGSTYVGSVSHGDFHSTITLMAMNQRADEWHEKWSYTFPHPKDVHSENEWETLLPCNAMHEREDFERPKIYIKVDDFDKDGKPELLVRTITCHIYRATGSKTRRHMYLFNLSEKGPIPSVEVLLEDHSSYTTITKVEFKDTNGDSHPDIYLSTTTENAQGSSKKEKVLLYDPKRDRFQ